MNFTLTNTGDELINDVQLPHIFVIDGSKHQITIRPQDDYWRFAVRFTIDFHGAGYSTSHRYNNPQIKHFEVCVGILDKEWHSPNVLKIQEYFITEGNQVYAICDNYHSREEVTIVLNPQPFGFMEVSVASKGISYQTTLDLGHCKVFQLYGWADKLPFKIETTVVSVLSSLHLKLEPLKALSKQKSEISIGRLAIFFGSNNSGKTSVLVAVANSFTFSAIEGIDYLGLNRVHSSSPYNIELEALSDDERKKKQGETSRNRVAYDVGQHAPFDWMTELALQDDETRRKVVTWMSRYFENWNFEEIRTGRYVRGVKATVNDLDPADQGSGGRAVLAIIIQLYNPLINVLAIDEPELALEPAIQKVVLSAMRDASEGKNGFPLKRVLIATHSHLFLDRVEIGNNYHVQKINQQVTIEPIMRQDQLQQVVYSMLGASPTDLFFPGNIVVVEGKSDSIFLEAVYRCGRMQGIFKNDLTFHFLEGFDKLSYAPDAIVQMFKTQAYTPIYKSRICGIFDQPPNDKFRARKLALVKSIRDFCEDAASERIVLLEQVAIEFYYPVNLINKIVGTEIGEMDYKVQVESYLNSISKTFPYYGQLAEKQLTKVEFASEIAANLGPEHLSMIDAQIINLLKTADKLAFS